MRGKVFGIDYSSQSVAASRRLNARLIEAGRVEIREGNVSKLPWPDETFDLVTAVETHYYWPGGVADMREVLRVIKPEGKLLIIAETYKGQSADIAYRPVMKLIGAKYMTLDEHRNLLSAAGFSNVQIFNNSGRGWMCVSATNPGRNLAPVP
jgi:Methylase involved in ubiquinone/menaquinone biosynthesis